MLEHTYLTIAIALLSSVTLNRGIYLYHQSGYEHISQLRSGTTVKWSEIQELEKPLRIAHFRFALVLSVVIMILGSVTPNAIVGHGLMLGSVLNIFYTSIMSWWYLEEGEKFTVSAGSLAALIGFVWYRYGK